MNFTGIWLGLFALFAIGIGFVWVIKLEYHVGAHIARLVAVCGGIIILASLFIPNFFVSALVGVLGGSIVWGAAELPEQRQRVEKGLFPANPKRRNHRPAQTGNKGDDQ